MTQAAENGYMTHFDGYKCVIYSMKDGCIALLVIRNVNSYKEVPTSKKIDSGEAHAVNETEEERNLALWNRRLRPLLNNVIRECIVKKSWGDGPTDKGTNSIKECVCCDRGKMRNRSFKPISATARAKNQLQLVHMHVCFPFRTDSLGKSR